MKNSLKVMAAVSTLLAGNVFAGSLPYPTQGSEAQLGGGINIESASTYNSVEQVTIQGANIAKGPTDASLYIGSH